MKYYPKYQIITKEKLYTALFFLQVRSGEGKIFSEKVNKSTTFEQMKIVSRVILLLSHS